MCVRGCRPEIPTSSEAIMRAHPDLNQGPADLQSAALTTELCAQSSKLPSQGYSLFFKAALQRIATLLTTSDHDCQIKIAIGIEAFLRC